MTFDTKSSQIVVVFIDLWSCLFTTKLSYAQLFKWGHSIPAGRSWSFFLNQTIWTFLIDGLFSAIPSQIRMTKKRQTHWHKNILEIEVDTLGSLFVFLIKLGVTVFGYFCLAIVRVWFLVFCFKNCSGLLREKLLKLEAEGWEFAKFLRSLEQFIRTVKGQTNFWNRMLF